MDLHAVETLGTALAGSDRALVIAFPTMALSPGHLATEEDGPDLSSVGGGRSSSEKTALALASRGVRASVVRIPPWYMVRVIHIVSFRASLLSHVNRVLRRMSGTDTIAGLQYTGLMLPISSGWHLREARQEEGITQLPRRGCRFRHR